MELIDRDLLIQTAARAGVRLSNVQALQFEKYAQALERTKGNLNVTSVPANEYLERHFLDSLLAARGADFGKDSTLIDIGTGGGFPGLPLKISFPHLLVTLVDSSAKKLKFIDSVIQELSLSGIALVHARAEDLGRDEAYREGFDIATARAVADLSVLVELVLPLVKVGGQSILLKGPSVRNELSVAAAGIQAMGGADAVIEDCSDISPITSLVCIKKGQNTPKEYPRSSKKIFSRK